MVGNPMDMKKNAVNMAYIPNLPPLIAKAARLFESANISFRCARRPEERAKHSHGWIDVVVGRQRRSLVAGLESKGHAAALPASSNWCSRD